MREIFEEFCGYVVVALCVFFVAWCVISLIGLPQ
jgi:hypothetical protein